jgi:hypothetical protein
MSSENRGPDADVIQSFRQNIIYTITNGSIPENDLNT